MAISGIETAQPGAPFPLGPTRLALRGSIRLLADRYGPEGVRFNAVALGLMESGESEFRPEWASTVRLGRVGRNDGVGRTIGFLVSYAADDITGKGLTVDGGVNRPLGI